MGHQFINQQPIYKLVGPLSIIQSKVVPFRNWAEQCESSQNNLEVGWMVYKQPEWHDSCTSLPNNMPERHESWPNNLQAYEQDNLAGVGRISLAKLASKAKTNIKKNWLTSFLDCFAASFQ